MNAHKKEIILNEIQFWKKNNLLPSHYCDFLLALYAGGDEQNVENEGKLSDSLLAKEKKRRIWMVLLLAIVTITMLVCLFTLNSFGFLPILMSSVFAFLLLIATMKLSRKRTIIVPLLFVSSALLILGLSFRVWSVYFSENPFLLLGLISANCILWFVSGVLLKLPYFTVSGIVGSILVVASLVLK